MPDLLALITILLWPVIPIFWIPVHLFSRFFKKIKYLSYLGLPAVWLPIAYFLYQEKTFILSFRADFPYIAAIAGAALLLAGTLIHIWTAGLLSIRGIIGMPEIVTGMKRKLVTGGAFSIVRNPTYLAHTLMFSGVFLLTGVMAVGAVALLDFVLVYFIIIPLEEKELTSRFGDEYRQYKSRVPKFFPRLVRF